MHSLVEVGQEADAVRTEIEQLYVRGLASSSPADRRKLAALAEEWGRIGAGHISARLMDALRAADAGTKNAPHALLAAHTSLNVFERVLSLEAASEAWSSYIAAVRDGDGEEQELDAPETPDTAAAKPGAAAPPIEDPKGALMLLDELSRAVEDLVRTGIPSATDATRAKLDASFKEASRRKFLRLGPSLRYVNDDMARFLANDPQFSIRRFSFFLHRSWLIARGMVKAIRDNNNVRFASLAAAPPSAPRPFKSIDVVTLGVLKRTVVSAFTFEFKLRVVAAPDKDLVGKSLTYSLVFPRKTEGNAKDLPGEAYLLLPQPQKFTPSIFRQGRIVTITDGAVMLDDRGGGKLALGPKSTLKEGNSFSDWAPLFTFNPDRALDNIRRSSPGPLDLAVELQEEIVVAGAKMGDQPIRSGDGRKIYALTGEGGLSLDVVIPDGTDSEELWPRLREGLKPPNHPLLYGVVYYEYGRTLLLPLSLLHGAGPRPPEEPEPEPAPAAKGQPARKKVVPAKDDKKQKAKKKDGLELLMLGDKKYDVSALVGNLF